MTTLGTRTAAIAIVGVVAATLHAQDRDWTTTGFDAQRTGWIRADPRISPATLQKPGEFGPFTFLWKLELEHDPAAPAALTQPVLLDRLIGFRGFKSIAFVGTASETVHAIDIDFGIPLWKYHINYTASPPPVLTVSAACPGGLTSAMSRPTPIAPPAPGRGQGGGAGARSGGGVGEPGRGATTLAAVAARRAAAPVVQPPAVPAAPAAPAGTVPGSAAAAAGAAPGGLPGGARQGGGAAGGVVGTFVPGEDAAYTLGSDGYLHALNVSNGWDNMTPALFLPANTRASGLIITTGGGGPVAYAATTNGCGSQPDAVWAMDLASPRRTVVAFAAGGATIAGTGGPTFGRDGTVYVATKDGSAPLSNSVVALEPRTLKLKASVTVPKGSFGSSPLVFPWKDGDAIALTGGGRLVIFSAASLRTGPVATVTLGSANHEAAGLASWLDAQNTRWIGVPAARGIDTFKVVEQDGKIALQPGWTSRPIAVPLTPLVINGVLFAASSGTRASPAVLYALDAASGKELWNSGRTITSPASGGLSGGQGNVYVPGADGTLYAFGFEIEK